MSDEKLTENSKVRVSTRMNRKSSDDIIIKVSKTLDHEPTVLKQGELAANIAEGPENARLWVGTESDPKEVCCKPESTSDPSALHEGNLVKIQDAEYFPQSDGSNKFNLNLESTYWYAYGGFSEGDIDIIDDSGGEHKIGGPNALTRDGGNVLTLVFSDYDTNGNNLAQKFEDLRGVSGTVITIPYNGNEYKFEVDDPDNPDSIYDLYDYYDGYNILVFEDDNNVNLPELDLTTIDGEEISVEIYPSTPSEESISYHKNDSSPRAVSSGNFLPIEGATAIPAIPAVESTIPIKDWTWTDGGSGTSLGQITCDSEVGDPSIGDGYGLGNVYININDPDGVDIYSKLMDLDNHPAPQIVFIVDGERYEFEIGIYSKTGSPYPPQYLDGEICFEELEAYNQAPDVQLTNGKTITLLVAPSEAQEGKIVISSDNPAFSVNASDGVEGTATSTSDSIAIGDGATAYNDGIVIGNNATCNGYSIVIGHDLDEGVEGGNIVLGVKYHNESSFNNVNFTGSSNFVIGEVYGGSNNAEKIDIASESVVIGKISNAALGENSSTPTTIRRSIVIGSDAKANTTGSVVIGYNSYVGGDTGVNLSHYDATYNVVIGANSKVNSNATGVESEKNVVIGYQSAAKTSEQSIIIGNDSEVKTQVGETNNKKIIIGNNVHSVSDGTGTYHQDGEIILLTDGDVYSGPFEGVGLRVLDTGEVETTIDSGNNWHDITGAANNWMSCNGGSNYTNAPDSSSASIAIGSYAIANGSGVSNAIALGDSTKAGSYSIAMGRSAESEGSGGISIGYAAGSNNVNGSVNNNVICIGQSARADAEDSINIVTKSQVGNRTVDTGTIVISTRNLGGLRVNADGSLDTTANGGTDWAAVGGGNNWLTANNGNDFTNAPSANNTDSIGIGENANADGYRAVAIGYQATSPGGVSIGSSADCTGGGTLALGNASQAWGLASVSLGDNTRGHGDFAIAIGSGAGAWKKEGVTIGHSAANSTTYGIVIGYQANINQEIGVSEEGAIVIGKNITISDSDDTRIILRTDTSALRVKTDGTLETSADGGTVWGPVVAASMNVSQLTNDQKEALNAVANSAVTDDKIEMIEVFRQMASHIKVQEERIEALEARLSHVEDNCC